MLSEHFYRFCRKFSFEATLLLDSGVLGFHVVHKS